MFGRVRFSKVEGNFQKLALKLLKNEILWIKFQKNSNISPKLLFFGVQYGEI